MWVATKAACNDHDYLQAFKEQKGVDNKTSEDLRRRYSVHKNFGDRLVFSIIFYALDNPIF